MTEQVSPEQKNEILFFQLVMTFHTAIMQHLGKIKNPMTDKIERNLEQARMSIDMLDMIKEKTGGNLTQNEVSLLGRLLREAKMNYVDEVDKEKRAASTKPSEEKSKSKKDKQKAEASSTDSEGDKETQKGNKV